MSEDSTMHTIVSVIQLDRDAAADSVFRRIKLQTRFINDDAIAVMVRAYRTGLHDKDEDVQEFARHRIRVLEDRP